LAAVRERLAARVTATIDQLAEMRDRSEVVIGGLITAVKRTTTRAGAAMAFLTLEDLTGSVEVIVFPKTYEAAHLVLKRDAVVLVRGRLDVTEQQAKVLAEAVLPLDDALGAGAPDGGAEVLHVVVDADRHGEVGLHRLRALLQRHAGDRRVLLTVRAAGREVRMQAGALGVAPGPRVVEAVEALLGPDTARWLPADHG
jgi:DNA polymerase-3 subunit alpha